MGVYVVVAVFPVLVTVLVLLARRHLQRIQSAQLAWREARLEEAADFGFRPATSEDLLVDVGGGIFGEGVVEDVAVYEIRGHEVRAFDFVYVTGAGTNLDTRTGHVLAVTLPAPLPLIAVVPQTVGGEDQELESPEFNRRFKIYCADDRYASAVLHPRLMAWMLDGPDLSWRIDGGVLVRWGDDRWTASAASDQLAELVEIAEMIPNFVLRDYVLTSE